MPAKKAQNRDGNTEKSSEPTSSRTHQTMNDDAPRAKRISRSARAVRCLLLSITFDAN